MGIIYKITSPTGKVYIGQTRNLKLRLKSYRAGRCKSQPRLYRSIMKHGFEKHKFELIEDCDNDFLNTRERYWQEFYVSTGVNGLNCMLTSNGNVSGVHSEKTKARYSEIRKGSGNSFYGKKHTPETKAFLSDINKLRKHTSDSKIKISEANRGAKNKMFGKKQSDESRKKISLALSGRKYTPEQLEKIKRKSGEDHPMFGKRGKLSPLYGRKHSEETKLKMSVSAKGKIITDSSKDKISKANGRVIVNSVTGEKFQSIKKAAESLGIKYATLKAMLSGKFKNKTNFAYG